MKQIRDYVEVMFKELPQTQEVLNIKENILDSMEEKYHELIVSGVKESVAIGQVIGEFGSIDEIKEALDLVEEPVEVYDSSFVAEYLEFIPKFAKYIASGVAIIIAGIAMISITDASSLEPLAIVLFFMCVGVAVSIFITQGVRLSRFDFDSSKALSSSDHSKVAVFIDRQQKRLAPMVATGVVVILLGVASEYIMDEYGLFLSGDGFIMLVCAMVGVYLFIVSGINTSLPQKLSEPRQITEKERTEEARWGEITGALMGITAMIYVGLGLWHRELFGILWIMFPIVALVMELIKAIFRK